MDRYVKRGSTSVVLRIPLNVAPGDGSGAPGASPNLIISVWPSGETAPTTYSGANFDDTIETITTLGTYQAPTSGMARAKGLNGSSYLEVHLDDAMFAKAGAELSIMVTDTTLIVASYTVGLSDLDIHNGEVNVKAWNGTSASSMMGGDGYLAVNSVKIGSSGDAADWIASTLQDAAGTLTVNIVGNLSGSVGSISSTIDGKSMVEALQIIAAMVGGKVSGAGTASEVFKGLDGSTTRATVTADEDGNRSAVAYG